MSSSAEPFSGPAVTALGLAAARSVESGRPDRLISDPLARLFFHAAGVTLPMRLDWPASDEEVSATERLHLHGSRFIGLRTRFYDDVLIAAARRGVRQALLIGAGLDARAFRLPLPSDFHLIELDQPALLEWKQTVLVAHAVAPTCRRSQCGVDLRERWTEGALQRGFDPDQPTAFIAEGLLPYLAAEDQDRLLGQIDHIAAPGSQLALDRIVGDPHAGDRVTDLSRRSGLDMTRLLAGGDSPDLAGMLHDRGWRTRDRFTAELADLYGRDLADSLGPDPGERAPAEPPWLDTTFLQADR